MLKLLKNLPPRDWLYAVICVVLIAAQVWLDITMPGYMNEITVLVETPGSVMSEVLQAGGMMLLCALGSLLAVYWIGAHLLTQRKPCCGTFPLLRKRERLWRLSAPQAAIKDGRN